jgi:hypothetical protein
VLRFRLTGLRLYVALAAFLSGIWLVALGVAASLDLAEAGKQPLWDKRTVSASVVVISLGAWLSVLSGFLLRRHNWARWSLMILLLLVVVSGFFSESQPTAAGVTHQAAVHIAGLGMPLLAALALLLLTSRPLQLEFSSRDLDHRGSNNGVPG